MKKPPVTLHVAAGMLAVLLSGCGRGLPDAVPDEYERIGDHIAIRADGASFSANAHGVPALELFDNGDYALFKLYTDCQGNVATDAGMRFAVDGAMRDDVAKRPWGKSETVPTLKPIADHLCELANASRSVADPDDDRAVLALLFGEAGSELGALWSGPSANNTDEKTVRRVLVLKKGRFSDGKRNLAFVITAASDPQCTYHACNGGIIGAALFEQAGSQWLLRAHDSNVDEVGAWGVVPSNDFIQILTPEGAPPLLAIESRSLHMGHGAGNIFVYGFVAGHLKKVLNVGSWAYDGTRDCDGDPDCMEFEAFMKLGKAAQIWPELVVQSIQGQAFDSETIYRFNGKDAYVEVPNPLSRRPVATVTPRQAEQIAAMRPIVIDSVRSAWKNDPVFSAAKVRALNLQPVADSSYHGKLAVRMNGQERDFVMRISISPENQYAWKFVKN